MPAADTRLSFDPEWRTTLFTLVLVPLMTWLGFWQLQRAEEKTVMAAMNMNPERSIQKGRLGQNSPT